MTPENIDRLKAGAAPSRQDNKDRIDRGQVRATQATIWATVSIDHA